MPLCQACLHPEGRGQDLKDLHISEEARLADSSACVRTRQGGGKSRERAPVKRAKMAKGVKAVKKNVLKPQLALEKACHCSVARTFYPKTSISPATCKHPTGPKSIKQVPHWARDFLKAIEKHKGYRYVVRCLKGISWNLTSCFSGIGCAEAV